MVVNHPFYMLFCRIELRFPWYHDYSETLFHWQWKINQVDSGLGSFSPLLPSKRAWQVTAMVDMDSPLQDPTSYTSDRQTRSRDAWLDQVLHCSCGCCGCLARHDKMIWMIHDSRIFKNHQLLKGTLRWIPKDGSPNHKDPKWYIHRYLATQTKRWRSAKVSSDMGGASAYFQAFWLWLWCVKTSTSFFGDYWITLPNHPGWPTGGLVVFYIVLPRWCITLKFNSEKPWKVTGPQKERIVLVFQPSSRRSVDFRVCKYTGFQRPKMLFGS